MPADIDPELLRRLLHYDHEKGKLFWKTRGEDLFEDAAHGAWRKAIAWNNRLAGKEAFTAIGNGYKRGSIFNQRYAAHRVAWAIYYGKWPDHQIDHIDGNKLNNSISNLRDVVQPVNGKNQRLSSNNTSGFNGVYWHANRWHSVIKIDGVGIRLGRFKNIRDAIDARIEADKKYGFHPNHGKSRD